MPKHPSHPPPHSSHAPAPPAVSAPATVSVRATVRRPGIPSATPALPRRERLLTVAEVAERVAFCPKTIRRWIQREELRVHRIGRQIRISEDDLQSFLASRYGR